MFRKVFPILLLILGSGAGIGAGIFLRPDALTPVGETEELSKEPPAKEVPKSQPDVSVEYVKLNNQFVVPIVDDKRVVSLIVMSLSIEVLDSDRDSVFKHEPKLRDSFLQVLFDHANMGGFSGAFTRAENLEALRNALTETGQRDLGKNIVKDVLITEIARQDY